MFYKKVTRYFNYNSINGLKNLCIGSDNLDTSVWIAIYLPLFIVIFASIAEQKRRTMYISRKKKKKGGIKMSADLIKNYIGS